MTFAITLLVLFAAVLHAAWNAMVKSTGDQLVIMTWIAGSSTVIAAPFVLYFGIPGAAVWKFLIAAACFHTAYMLLLVRAYSLSDFGKVYPLARGFAPAVVTLAGFVLLGEVLSTHAILGIALIVIGTASLALRNSHASGAPRDLRGVGYALATGIAIAGYSVIDGVGGRTAATPLMYIAWLFLLEGIPITVIALIRLGPQQLLISRSTIAKGVGGAAMSIVAYGIVIWAMTRAPLGAVSAMRETSVVFGALLSGWVLKEGLGPFAVAAACIVAAGVILLRVT